MSTSFRLQICENCRPIFVSMSGKKSDVFLDAWLPITMKDYMDQYGDSIEFLGEVYGEARVGLVVPQYVTIQSINELEANKDRFSSDVYKRQDQHR